MQRTFVMVKPDGVQRRLVGEIISRLEAKGLQLAGIKLMQMDKDLAEHHYAVHRDKPFFTDLVSYVTSGPVVAMAWQGRDAIEAVRNLVGATNPLKAAPGSIRGDFGLDMGGNLVHASDGPDAAESELASFFTMDELLDYPMTDRGWVSP